MLAELVRTETDDGLRLDGALHEPAARNAAADVAGPTAVVVLHGVSGNFYSSTLLEVLAASLVEEGHAALRANTRGHDLVTLGQIAGRVRWEGAAFETVSKCTRDVSAWIKFLRDRGYRRVALAGHSLGAIKSLYAASHGSEPGPDAIVAMSPPRLSYQAFMNGPEQPAFFEAIQIAREHVRQARGSALIQVRFPFPLLISAGSYLDKYGPDENYNILKFASRAGCPLLFVYGERELAEGGVAFAGLPEALSELDYAHSHPEFVTVAAADHMYSGLHEEAARPVVTWLSQQLRQA